MDMDMYLLGAVLNPHSELPYLVYSVHSPIEFTVLVVDPQGRKLAFRDIKPSTEWVLSMPRSPGEDTVLHVALALANAVGELEDPERSDVSAVEALADRWWTKAYKLGLVYGRQTPEDVEFYVDLDPDADEELRVALRQAIRKKTGHTAKSIESFTVGATCRPEAMYVLPYLQEDFPPTMRPGPGAFSLVMFETNASVDRVGAVPSAGVLHFGVYPHYTWEYEEEEVAPEVQQVMAWGLRGAELPDQALAHAFALWRELPWGAGNMEIDPAAVREMFPD